MRCISVVLLLTSTAVRAQETENAVLRARDAFGERVGVEQVGLYSESQVRGFSLADTASYRLEGSYFQREYQLHDMVLSGTSVKVGIAAARLDYPSPSGVVEHRLRSSKSGDRNLYVNFGIRENDTHVVELSGSYATEDGRYGVAGGAQWQPKTQYGNGTGGHNEAIGAVPQWRPNEKILVRGVLSFERSEFNGTQSLATAVAALPPKAPKKGIGNPYAKVLRHSHNSGVLVDAELAPNWDLRTSIFYADTERTPDDFTIVSLSPNRTATVTQLRTQHQHGRSLTGEAVLKRFLTTANASHEISGALRGRRSRALTETLPPVVVARFPFDAISYPTAPVFAPSPGELHSDVDQNIVSLGYAGDFFDFIEVRGGLHRVHYVKDVQPPTGAPTKRVENNLVYNASIVAAMSPQWTLFANTVKGVEESGIAPASAINRNEVLPPITAEEFEIGSRYVFPQGLSVTLSGFDTRKLSTGLRPDGIFTLVGKVRHRGGEVSISGDVTRDLTVVVGALAMKPRLSGQLVDAGTISSRPVGVSSTAGVASFDYRARWAPGLSFDSRLTYTGPRPANVRNTFGTKGLWLWSAGGRYAFAYDDHPMLLRFVMSNIFVDRPNQVSASGLFSQFYDLNFRLTLRVALYGD